MILDYVPLADHLCTHVKFTDVYLTEQASEVVTLPPPGEVEPDCLPADDPLQGTFFLSLAISGSTLVFFLCRTTPLDTGSIPIHRDCVRQRCSCQHMAIRLRPPIPPQDQ